MMKGLNCQELILALTPADKELFKCTCVHVIDALLALQVHFLSGKRSAVIVICVRRVCVFNNASVITCIVKAYHLIL